MGIEMTSKEIDYKKLWNDMKQKIKEQRHILLDTKDYYVETEVRRAIHDSISITFETICNWMRGMEMDGEPDKDLKGPKLELVS